MGVPAYVADALDLADAFQRAADPAEAFHGLRAWLERFGASAVLVTGLPLPERDPTGPRMLLNGWPDAWRERYLGANHYRHDPCVRWCLSQREPFLWSELPGAALAEPRARWVMHEAAEFGLVRGLCVPLHDSLGFHGALTTAGPGFDLPSQARFMAHLLAHQAYGAAVRPGVHREGRATVLTAREREVLRWAGAGKTGWEIGTILGISESTVEKHLRAVRAKLDVATTAQAVAEGLRLNQIFL